ncbi:MAG: methylated-DNA--[protein]-cysteine S-methyltransferase [Gammaproteobacteria bacterium]|nr:methylated-DNA--[protein]-cysteine S-methyltransferase [Gammaproteobacteria bacterium]
MKSFQTSQIQTPIKVGSGAMVWLEIEWNEQAIISISFTTRQNVLADDLFPKAWLEPLELYWTKPLEPLTQKALANLPLKLAGTDYQQKVWTALRQIPTGESQSYGALSNRLKSSPRAVASACRANPTVLVVPCHRVISKSGIGGFMGVTEGEPIDIKRWLLEHER